MLKVIWSPKALEDFEQNIEFLEQNYGEKVTLKFIQKTKKVVGIISSKPLAFPASSYKEIRKVPIVSKLSIYYRVLLGEKIEILRLWNNLQEPSKLKI